MVVYLMPSFGSGYVKSFAPSCAFELCMPVWFFVAGCIKKTCAFIALLSALLATSIEPSFEALSPTKMVVHAKLLVPKIALIATIDARIFPFIFTPLVK